MLDLCATRLECRDPPLHPASILGTRGREQRHDLSVVERAEQRGEKSSSLVADLRAHEAFDRIPFARHVGDAATRIGPHRVPLPRVERHLVGRHTPARSAEERAFVVDHRNWMPARETRGAPARLAGRTEEPLVVALAVAVLHERGEELVRVGVCARRTARGGVDRVELGPGPAFMRIPLDRLTAGLMLHRRRIEDDDPAWMWRGIAPGIVAAARAPHAHRIDTIGREAECPHEPAPRDLGVDLAVVGAILDLDDVGAVAPGAAHELRRHPAELAGLRLDVDAVHERAGPDAAGTGREVQGAHVPHPRVEVAAEPHSASLDVRRARLGPAPRRRLFRAGRAPERIASRGRCQQRAERDGDRARRPHVSGSARSPA
jgi:hypothetical protein